MLVLTRKPAEMIQIGEDIVVKVIKTAKGSVKIGIQAPANVRVIRAELLERNAAEPVAPSATTSDTPANSVFKTTELRANVA